MVDALHALLSIKERLNMNLSGNQIAAILDTLLVGAAYPVLESSDFIECAIAELLTPIFSNGRRKYSNVERSDFLNKMFTLVVIPSKRRKKVLLSEIRIERNVLFDTLSEFYKRTATYESLYTNLWSTTDPVERTKLLKQLNDIEKSVLLTHNNLYTVIRNSKHLYDVASNFKGMVIEKYIRLAFRKSQESMANTKLQISQLELLKNLILSVNKAICKYDPDKGALTSYIDWWFKDGINQSANSHEYGIAYVIPAVQRRKMQAENVMLTNFYTDIESLVEMPDTTEGANLEENLMNKQRQHVMSRIVRQADVDGIAMLLLGIQYSLTDSECDALRATMDTSTQL